MEAFIRQPPFYIYDSWQNFEIWTKFSISCAIILKYPGILLIKMEEVLLLLINASRPVLFLIHWIMLMQFTKKCVHCLLLLFKLPSQDLLWRTRKTKNPVYGGGRDFNALDKLIFLAFFDFCVKRYNDQDSMFRVSRIY